MLCQFLLDKGSNHGAVDAFGHIRVGAQLFCQGAGLGDDLFYPLRSFHRVAVFFKASGLGHISTALGDQSDDLAIQPVNVLAHLFKGITGYGHVLKLHLIVIPLQFQHHFVYRSAKVAELPLCRQSQAEVA